MAGIAEKLLTAKEFLLLPEPEDGSKQELVRGEVVTVAPPPGFDHGVVQLRIGGVLDAFVRANRLGRCTVESGVILDSDPDTVRGPDVSFWSAAKLPMDQRPLGYPDAVADLCIEVLSPKKTRRKIQDKLEDYFNGGVRLVWIVDSADRTVTVYRKTDEGRVLHESATLSGEDVVPGFTCNVAEVFE